MLDMNYTVLSSRRYSTASSNQNVALWGKNSDSSIYFVNYPTVGAQEYGWIVFGYSFAGASQQTRYIIKY